MAKTITENAQMQCTLGTAPVPLTVTNQLTVKISGAKVATEMDKTPMAHIPSFGVCKCGSPPPPCVPAPTAWQKTSAVHTIDGKKEPDRRFLLPNLQKEEKNLTVASIEKKQM